MTDKPTVTIYTDGGAAPNPGPGGWGAILIAASGTTKELSGAALDTTNNRMELTAALEALRALKRPCRVEFYTDSKYLQKGISEWLPGWIRRNWQRKGDKPLENEDLWRALNDAIQTHEIVWQWVKGHAGDTYNERADQLATAARDTLTGSMEANLAVDYEIALRVSAKGQDKPGGWALRLWDAAADSATVHTGREKSTTSNRLSLVAALEGLRLVPEGAAVRVYTSNSYLHDGITTWVQGWIRQHWTKKDGEPVKYSDLWQALVQESGARGVHWVMERGDPPALAEGLDKLASESYAD